VRARALADGVLLAADAQLARSAIDARLGVRREAELWLATARAHAQRIRGHVDPATWGRLAHAWGALPMPYVEAKARWWQGLAILASASSESDRDAARQAARKPLGEAYRLARELPSAPLMRAVADLSSRARVSVPLVDEILRGGQDEAAPAEADGGPRPESEGQSRGRGGLVAVGPGRARLTPTAAIGPGLPDGSVSRAGQDIARAIEERVIASLRRGPSAAYGLSPREQEVLTIVAEGRTDREIAARLFISERTVHVHVRRILAKLGVASRTEAAGLAIRQGLVPGGPPEAVAGAGIGSTRGGMT
jgi:DNA-binding CsgD family transcriptional regulator